jgi:hypothetical protein
MEAEDARRAAAAAAIAAAAVDPWMQGLLAAHASPPFQAETPPRLTLADFAPHTQSAARPLLDLALGFQNALPPPFLRALLAQLDALAAAAARPAEPPALHAARLRAGLAPLAAHLAPHFAALEARVGQPFAGPTPPTTRSTVFYAARAALLPCFSLAEAAPLRAVSKEFAAAIAEHAWADTGTRVRSLRALARLRAAFPRATALNLSRLACTPSAAAPRDAGDAALAPFLPGLRTVDLSTRTALTGACLPALAAHCTALNLTACRSLRGPALSAFAGSRLHTLDVSDCPQLQDAHLAGCSGLVVLRAARCSGLAGTFAEHFRGGRLEELNLGGCEHPALGGEATLAAFTALSSLRVLCVARCPGVRDAHFAALSAAAGSGMVALRVLDISFCSGLTSAAFAFLGTLQILYMGGITQPAVDAAALGPLNGAGGLQALEMSMCSPSLVRAARARGLPVQV